MVEKAEEYYRLVKEEKADTPDALKVKKELDEIEACFLTTRLMWHFLEQKGMCYEAC